MGRGGEYFIVAFLSGSIICGICQCTIGVVHLFGFLLSLSTLFAAVIIVLHTGLLFSSAPKYKRVQTVLIYLVFFMLGGINMQRCPERQSTQEWISKAKIQTENNALRRHSLRIRENLSLRIKKIIPQPPEQAVAIAFTLGDKSHIPYSLKQAYKNSGAMHVLALSGLHIGIIYGIICLFLSFLNIHYKTRRIKLIISTIIIVAYAYITGFSPSVQRAGIMIFTWQMLAATDRKIGKWSVLTTAAGIILLINPNELSSIGFQLSFAAVAGITALYPIINGSLETCFKHKKCIRLLKPVWSLISLSTACQITTAPLVWYYFHTTPPYFLLTNLVAVPLVAVSLYTFAITVLTSGMPVVGEMSALLLQKLVGVLNDVINYLGN